MALTFVFLLIDNETNRILVRCAVTRQIQTVIFRYIDIPLKQLLVLGDVYRWTPTKLWLLLTLLIPSSFSFNKYPTLKNKKIDGAS